MEEKIKNKGQLVPFHYYGIYDETDYTGIRLVKGHYEEQEFARYGLTIPRQNMANWMIRIAEDYMGILYRYLRFTVYPVQKLLI